MTLSMSRLVTPFAIVTGMLAANGTALPANAAQTPLAIASDVHQTAPTRYVDAGGTRLAYRRFGKPGGTPVLFFQHFVGTMDNWDPQVVDGIARSREVILFDNAGVAGSGGEVPTSIEAMAHHAIALVTALDIPILDVLAFSMGSMVAQQITVERPDLVRRLVLIGSTPRGGVGMATLTPEFRAALEKKRAVPDELLLDTLFTPSAASQAAGRLFLDRVRARNIDRDTEVNDKVAPAQTTAIAGWGAPEAVPYAYLAPITQPVLLVEGSKDLVFYTVNAFNLLQHLANAELIIYPDTGHGPQDQYPDRFVQDVTTFLDDPSR